MHVFFLANLLEQIEGSMKSIMGFSVIMKSQAKTILYVVDIKAKIFL